MNAIQKTALLAALTVGVTFALVAAASWGLRGDVAQADPVVITSVGIDVEPDDNTPNNIVDVDTCRRIDAGQTDQVDVFMMNFPPEGANANPPQDLAGYNYKLYYLFEDPASPTPGPCNDGVDNGGDTQTDAADADCTGMAITTKNHVNQYINLAGGTPPYDYLGDNVPDADGTFKVVVYDWSLGGIPETVAGQGPNGVLGHYDLTVGVSTPPGYYLLQLTDIRLLNSALPAKDQYDAVHLLWGGVDTDKDGAIDEDLILDKTYNPVHGIIAVGQDCPTPSDLGKNSLAATLTPGQDVLVGTDVLFTLIDKVQNYGPIDPVSGVVTTVCTPPANTDGSLLANECSYTCVGGETVKCGTETLTTDCVAATNYICTHPNALSVKETAAALAVAEGERTFARDWDLKCGEASTHVWEFENSIANEEPLIPEPSPDPHSNTASLSVPIDCIAPADIGVSDVLSALPAAILADDCADNDGDTLVDEDPADWTNNDGDPLTDEDGGTVLPVTVTKTITNYGPYSPVLVDWTATGVATFNGVTINPYCTLTPTTATSGQVSVALGTPATVNVTYVLHCNRSGHQYDDDGDSPDQPCSALPGPTAPPVCLNWVDEDPPDAVDNDSDGLTDEDGPLTWVFVKVTDTVASSDPHIVEPEPDPSSNTDTDFSPVVLGVLPFAPTFSAVVDEADPSTDASPVDDDCVVGMPCKRQFSFAIPKGNPLALPRFTQPMSSAAGGAGGLTLTAGSAIPTGDKVGRISNVVIGLSILNGSCNPIPMAPFDLLDGALPGEDPDGSTVANNEPDAATALANPLSWSTKLGSVVTMIDLGVRDKDGDQKEDGTAGTPGVYQCADGVDNDGDGTCDTGGCATGLADANCLAGPGIDEDPVDTVDNDGDGLIDEDVAEPDGVPGLWARKVGVTMVGPFQIPVNILIFNAGPRGWLEYMVPLDPDEDQDGIYDEVDTDDDNDMGTGTCAGTNPAIPQEDGSASYSSCRDFIDNGADTLIDSNDPDCWCGADPFDADDDNDGILDGAEVLTAWCTPFSATILELGQSVTTATTLATCDDIKLDHQMGTDFIRADIGTTTTVLDTVSCSPSETDASVGLSKDEDVGNEAPMSESGACDDALDNDADGYVDLADADCDRLGAGLSKDYPVTVQVVNGAGPTDIVVDLSIVSHDPCQADWIPQPGDTLLPPSKVGDTYTSGLQWTEAAMVAFEMRQARRQYSLHCTQPGTFSGQQAIQVTATVTASLPDPNPGNNEATNQIDSIAAVADIDGDTFTNDVDNCPLVSNSDQTDTDGDLLGNACDDDDDNDTLVDASDNCPLATNPGQEDLDDDGLGDACDDDSDNDTVLDASDNCPLLANADQANADGDALGNACDPDDDNDTVLDGSDNCPLAANADQADADADSLGNACDPNDDNDGFTDDQENTLGSDPLNAESTPEHISLPATCADGRDNDLDVLVDGYDLGCDVDHDGIPNVFDACPALAEDMDGFQDADGCPDTDNDMDGVCDPWITSSPACDGSDGCPNVQEDIDSFHDTDGCPDPDNDGDGFPDHTDQCPATDWTAGPDGDPATLGDNPLDENMVPIDTREDYDGVIDVDGCHDSPGDDWDGDGIADETEAFVAGTNPMDMDSDDDGLCDGSAPPLCSSEDLDNDGIVDPGETDPLNPDSDGDGLTDGLERGLTQPETPGTNVASPNWQPDSDPSTTTDPVNPDSDGDGLTDGVEDADQDGETDPGETSAASADTDEDGHGDTADNCPIVNNPGQEDFEPDGIGDHCDDSDTDAFTDYVEFYVGTDVLDACPDDPTDDAWPADINMDGWADVGDILMYKPVILTAVPPSPTRYDLAPDQFIDVGDILMYKPVILTQCGP